MKECELILITIEKTTRYLHGRRGIYWRKNLKNQTGCVNYGIQPTANKQHIPSTMHIAVLGIVLFCYVISFNGKACSLANFLNIIVGLVFGRFEHEIRSATFQLGFKRIINPSVTLAGKRGMMGISSWYLSWFFFYFWYYNLFHGIN